MVAMPTKGLAYAGMTELWSCYRKTSALRVLCITIQSSVKPSMFNMCDDNSDVFSNLSANTPDTVVVNEGGREVLILEVGCTFDSSLEEAFLTKILKYQQLKQTISQLGYKCTLLLLYVHIWQSRSCSQVGG